MKKTFYAILLLLQAETIIAQNHLTPFEKSQGQKTATYDECTSYYKLIDKQFSNIILKTYKSTDAGLPLSLVLFCADRTFDPVLWHKNGKVVLLINNGIHAGEPDGIDASMMLIRDLASGKIKAPKNVAIAVIPLYNIGGALNRNSYSRVNQQGPESYGFRGNGQNLDLNRDFTKNDSRNARAFAEIFHYLDPDIFMDNHVSDGADYQHVMTLLSTQHNKLGQPLDDFLHQTLEPALYKNMEQKNYALTPYVNFESGSPEKGWSSFYDAPRYSSGYAALFQIIGFMPETHMLKPFKERVLSTYALMQAMVEETSKKAAEIKRVKLKMIDQVIHQKEFELSWKPDTTYFEPIWFKGYESNYKTSSVTGLPKLYYDRQKPFNKQVKYFNRYQPEKTVTIPQFYVIPQGWWTVIDILRLNQVKFTRIKKDTTLQVEGYKVERYKSLSQPYEKHHKNYEVEVSRSVQPIFFRQGDYLIECNQRANRYLAEMLEPTGDDSFFAWNFFDAILQQKEGYSDYRWEDVAAEYLRKDTALQRQFDEKKKNDNIFSASSPAQLNYIYKHSPYYEPAHMRYPVYRWNPK